MHGWDEIDLVPDGRGPGRDRRKLAIGALVAAILLVGAITLVVGDDGRPERVASAGERERDDIAGSTTSTSLDATTTSDPDDTTTTRALRTTTTEAAVSHDPPTTTVPAGVFRGVAVDPDGRPLGGVRVYSERSTTRTKADGSYEIPCPGSWVLLTGAPMRWDPDRTKPQADDDLNVAPSHVSVEAGACSDDPEPVVTVLHEGAIIEGTYSDPNGYLKYYISSDRLEAQAEVLLPPSFSSDPSSCGQLCDYVSSWLWLPDEVEDRVDLSYRLVGVPPGDVRLVLSDKDGGRFAVRTVHVEAGETLHLDATIGKPGYCNGLYGCP